MDEYKLSQTPDAPSEAPEGKNEHRPKAYKIPKHRDTQKISPQLLIGGIAAALVMVVAGVAWSHWYASRNQPSKASPSTSDTSTGKGVVTISQQTFNTVTGAISDKKPGNLTALYKKRVHLRIVRAGINQTVDADQVNALITDPLSHGLDPWNFHVPSNLISQWQQGPYGEYFTGNDLIGISANGDVISISFDDNGQIDGVFIAPESDLTNHDSGNSGGNNNGGQSGGGSNDNSDDNSSPVNPSTPTGVNAED